MKIDDRKIEKHFKLCCKIGKMPTPAVSIWMRFFSLLYMNPFCRVAWGGRFVSEKPIKSLNFIPSFHAFWFHNLRNSVFSKRLSSSTIRLLFLLSSFSVEHEKKDSNRIYGIYYTHLWKNPVLWYGNWVVSSGLRNDDEMYRISALSFVELLIE